MYIIIHILAPKELKSAPYKKDACYSCHLLGSDLFSNVKKLLLEYTSGI